MALINDKIARLSDRDALRIIDSLVGEFADEGMPETRQDQTLALAAVFRREGADLDLSQTDRAATPVAGAAARQLLTVMAQVPELAPTLEDLVEHPPTQEALALPLVLTAPIVLSGCILVLQVAGHTQFVRNPDGTWGLRYDSGMETSLGKSLGDIITMLKDVVTIFRPTP